MFDIGWSELLLIGIVALIVVGPKELPGLFRTVGQYMGKARGMAREFQRSMEQAADQSGLKEAADSLRTVNNFNVKSPTKMAKSLAGQAIGGKSEDATGAAKPDPDPAPAASGPVAAADRAVSGDTVAGAGASGVAAPAPGEEAGSTRT